MKKCVNGVMVDMSQEEIDQRLREEQEYLNWKAQYGYIAARQDNYPPIGDQLDAVLKQFEAMKVAGININVDLQSIIDQWNAVKAQYPKPQL